MSDLLLSLVYFCIVLLEFNVSIHTSEVVAHNERLSRVSLVSLFLHTVCLYSDFGNRRNELVLSFLFDDNPFEPVPLSFTTN